MDYKKFLWLPISDHDQSADKKSGEEIPIIFGSFVFDSKLYDVIKNKNFVLCHTHCSNVRAEFEFKPFSGAIIGFEKVSEKLEKLIHETFYKGPQFEEIKVKEIGKNGEKVKIFGKYLSKQIPFDFSDELFDSILQECSPAIRLFYTEKGKPKRIPLYLGEKEL